ncbi:hypothetical protein D1953_00985 [Peribacillus asahii]|uniref:Uncharacterized protein n=1 Tax=Peribacillus asahii TaxID=228899 RepID=A0A398BGD0_9BACI|nr:hypothetical protein [Peribacillus asahii]RID89172.1 hypothetical protein D1953_00985 [Peribacillus asahii]
MKRNKEKEKFLYIPEILDLNTELEAGGESLFYFKKRMTQKQRCQAPNRFFKPVTSCISDKYKTFYKSFSFFI